MKNTKQFNIDTLEKASMILKAMAHPMRVAILNLLIDGKKLSVTEIHFALGIEQSTTSHHLGILKDKGVLKSEREGKNSFYTLKNKNLEHIIECLNKCAECA
jgi:DNA-binding transcriptional ArsR family regulator